MAHSWDGGRAMLAAALAAAAAFAAPEARALALGDVQVRSALGESLDLRIPVTIDKGESIEPSCFALERGSSETVPRLTAGRVSLERSASGTYLRVRTEAFVSEPALVLGIVAACPGQFAEMRREYSILIDPRRPGDVQPSAAPVAATPALAPAPQGATPAPAAPAAFPSIATLIARIGDTLESIANAIFPRNRAAKNSYIRALRETNPPLASLGERDPIPVDTPIALPDLRTFARARPHAATELAAAPREERPPRRERAAAPAAPRGEPSAMTARAPAAREEKAAPRRATVRPQTVSPGFVLKLSSGEIDLAPSRNVDDRMRKQLRDRQLVLDADDQVAAVLALRNSVRQLESRVAELQLKLAGMPSSFPAPRETPAAPAQTAPVPSALPQPAQAAPAQTVPAKVEPPVAATSPAPAVEPSAAAPSAAPAPVATATPEAPTTAATTAEKTPVPPSEPAKPAAPAAKKAAPHAETIDWLYYGLWALAFLLVAAAIVLATRLARRNRDESDLYAEPTMEPGADDEIVVAVEPPPRVDAYADGLDEAPRRSLDADVDIATRLPDNNTDDLRRRYIEERFPEIGKGAISLDDPDSVVKGARLFYEDRAIARAVELLHFAIERHPGEVKSWLALFEIYRLEALKGEFADLARRFRAEHGASDYWRKVQYFGREIDPGNELYAEKPVNAFETIGPTQAKRMAEDASFDPIAENWLGAPMDFQNEVLANELRKALMARAGIAEGDLVPNPMPALRNVEMFTVA